MKVKKLQDKLDRLYDNVDPSERKQDDKKILQDELNRHITRENWKNNPSRREKSSKRQKERNKKIFGKGVYIVRSPGNDLLDYYDKKNAELKGRYKKIVPPSIIFKIRFRTKFPKTKIGANGLAPNPTSIVRDIIKPYKKNIKSGDAIALRKHSANWLVDKPHKEWKFTYKDEVSLFLTKEVEKSNEKVSSGHGKFSGRNVGPGQNTDCFWNAGPLAGWSVIYKNNKLTNGKG